MWYTPKHDEHGRIIDPFGQTPAERKEKTTATPAGNRIIRPPLYVETPKEVVRIANSVSSQEQRSSLSLQQQPSTIDHVDLSTFELKSTSIETSIPESYTVPVARSTVESEFNPVDVKIALPDNEANEFSDIPECVGGEATTGTDTVVSALVENSNVSDVSVSTTDLALVQIPDHYLAILKIPPKPSQRVSTRAWELHYAVRIETNKKSLIKRRLCVLNCCGKRTGWTLKQVGPTKFTGKGETHIIEEGVFHLDCSSGKLEKNEHKRVVLSFFPIRHGLFTALFQMKANGYVIQCNVEVAVDSGKQNCSSSFSSTSLSTSFSLSDSSLGIDRKSPTAFDLKLYLAKLQKDENGLSSMTSSVASSVHLDAQAKSSPSSPGTTTSSRQGSLLASSNLINHATPLVKKSVLKDLAAEATPIVKKWKLPTVEETVPDVEATVTAPHSPVANRNLDQTPISKAIMQSPQTVFKLTNNVAKTESDMFRVSTEPRRKVSQHAALPLLDPMTPKGYSVSHDPPVYSYNLMTPKPQELGILDRSLQNLQHVPLTPNTKTRIRAKLNEANLIDINFGEVRLKESKTINLKICNADDKNILVNLAVTGDFSIPIRELMITPRSYVLIPIRLIPSMEGIVREMLIIRKREKTSRVHLFGMVL
jgi:hypothetical protein